MTRSRVESAWEERCKKWFRRCAWPLTDERWVIWSEDPDHWSPMNHSCDPNAWLERYGSHLSDYVRQRRNGGGMGP